jgi:hypothetical protein
VWQLGMWLLGLALQPASHTLFLPQAPSQEDTGGKGRVAEDGSRVLLLQPTWQRQQGTRSSMWAGPRPHRQPLCWQARGRTAAGDSLLCSCSGLKVSLFLKSCFLACPFWPVCSGGRSMGHAPLLLLLQGLRCARGLTMHLDKAQGPHTLASSALP